MALVLCALLLIPGSWAQNSKSQAKAKTAAKATTHKATVHTKYSKKSRYSRSRRTRGQQAITSDRTREIQQALIRQRYLQGEPTGAWDSRTKAALVKFQHDNGWQTKLVPDSRALIKLGLGPSHDGLLNPESAAIGNPNELGLQNAVQTQADAAHK